MSGVLQPTPDQAVLAPLREFMLPGSAQAAFLGACLGIAPPPRELPDEGGDPVLLPLLGRAVAGNDSRIAGGSAALLRAARAHEAIRGEAFERAVAEVLGRLGDAGIEVVALPGAAFAETLYGDWSTRHSHDLDLLVRAHELPAAVAALPECAPTDPGGAVGEGSVVLRHPKGMPVALHTHLLRGWPAGSPASVEIGKTIPASLAGREALELSPPTALAYVLYQSRWAHPGSLRWASDAHLLVSAGGFDWERAAAEIARLRVALLAWLGLKWLQDAVGPAAPPAAMQRIVLAERGDPVLRDVLLSALAAAEPGRPMAMLRSTGSVVGAVRLASAMLGVSPEYLAHAGYATGGVRARRTLRAARYGARVLRARGGSIRSRQLARVAQDR